MRPRIGAAPRRRWLGLVALLLCLAPPAGAAADSTVKLHASFVPYRLGASTTVRFGFDVGDDAGMPAEPVTGVDLGFPAGLNQNASDLGLAVCSPAALAARGPRGCPIDSKVGFGSAAVEVAFGERVVRQRISISTFAGPPESRSELLFYNEGRTPIASTTIFSARGKEGSKEIFGGSLETDVPLIPTVPEGDYLALTSFESTLGPLGLTYERTLRGHTERFRPEGILLPGSCPAGGFGFQVRLRFADGGQAADRTTVPCPGGKRRPKR
jgi:hypothetical protein